MILNFYHVHTVFFGIYLAGSYPSKRMAMKVADRYVRQEGHRWAVVTLDKLHHDKQVVYRKER